MTRASRREYAAVQRERYLQATRAEKRQRRAGGAIHHVWERLPVPLVGLDSDNGSEFINHGLYDWCQRHGVTFTRSRACFLRCIPDHHSFVLIRDTSDTVRVQHVAYEVSGWEDFPRQADLPHERGLDPGTLTAPCKSHIGCGHPKELGCCWPRAI